MLPIGVASGGRLGQIRANQNPYDSDSDGLGMPLVAYVALARLSPSSLCRAVVVYVVMACVLDPVEQPVSCSCYLYLRFSRPSVPARRSGAMAEAAEETWAADDVEGAAKRPREDEEG